MDVQQHPWKRLLAYILHASANTWTRIFSIDFGNEVQFWIGASLTLILALFVINIAGAENLSRSHVRIQEELKDKGF